MFIQLLLKFKRKSALDENTFLQKGFTLIELLVVILITGILTAIALPNLSSQTSKARQSEAKIILGNINRGQQTYRYENGAFSSNLSSLDVTFEETFYSYSIDEVNGSASVTQQAIAIPAYEEDIKDYASGVYYFINAVEILAIICEANNATGSASASIDINVADCDGNSSQIR